MRRPRVRRSVQTPKRTPVSIVSIVNDRKVLEDCLARSLSFATHDLPTELIVVDNCDGQHATAGDALAEGLGRSQHEVVALVHQDVYLHSISAVEQAGATVLDNPNIGLLGAIGITGGGRLAGRMRDRWTLIGRSASGPVEVESVDEVFLMARREQLLRLLMSNDRALAWHAYGVEYGLRVRASGAKVVATDLHLTHNSMATNLSGLGDAHRRILQLHPELRSIQTTVGPLQSGRSLPGRMRSKVRGARIWLAESCSVVMCSVVLGTRDVTIADIRNEVDGLAEFVGAKLIRVLTPPRQAAHMGTEPLTLNRNDIPVSFESGGADAVTAAMESSSVVLMANVSPRDLMALRRAHVPAFAGYRHDTGAWVVFGPSAHVMRDRTRPRRSRAFGVYPLAGRG